MLLASGLKGRCEIKMGFVSVHRLPICWHCIFKLKGGGGLSCSVVIIPLLLAELINLPFDAFRVFFFFENARFVCQYRFLWCKAELSALNYWTNYSTIANITFVLHDNLRLDSIAHMLFVPSLHELIVFLHEGDDASDQVMSVFVSRMLWLLLGVPTNTILFKLTRAKFCT